MKRIFFSLAVLACCSCNTVWAGDDLPLFHHTDPLAQRDEWGILHNYPAVNQPDWEGRYHSRWMYYFKANEQLVLQPAYVGALQDALRRRGYYCGEIDGYFSGEVSDAIARMQKNYSMRVTGTLTEPVRRALHLP